MKTLKMLGAVVVLSGLVGCAGSVCEDAADSLKELSEKAKPCGLSVNNTFSVERCEAGLDKCTDADREQIRKTIDCIGTLKACTPGQEEEFMAASKACDDDVSDTCEEAAF